MNMSFYLIFVLGDIEPELVGPFKDPEARDQRARELREEHGDEHGIFKLTMERPPSEPTVSAYSGGFFEEEM